MITQTRTLVAGLAVVSFYATPSASLNVEIMGPPRPLINIDERCAEGDFPDAPARVFRDASGMLVLYATHHVNRIYVGRGASDLTKQCEVAFAGADSSDPSEFDARAWIASTWTFDGIRVAALVHNEFQSHRFAGKCKYNDYRSCWYSFVTLATSNNGGRSFQRASRLGPIAAPAHTADQGGPRPRGFFGSSNIVEFEGALYAITMTTGWEGQRRGNCLLRTTNPFDEKQWEILTEAGFVASVSNPYKGLSRPACRILSNLHGDIGGVVQHRPSGLFLAFSFMPGGKDKGTLVFSTSKDLQNWSRPQGIGVLPNQFSTGCHQERYYYPSVVDFESKARNFDTVGATATLILTHAEVLNCTLLTNRRLIMFPLRISN